jgi:hypothetical protein
VLWLRVLILLDRRLLGLLTRCLRLHWLVVVQLTLLPSLVRSLRCRYLPIASPLIVLPLVAVRNWRRASCVAGMIELLLLMLGPLLLSVGSHACFPAQLLFSLSHPLILHFLDAMAAAVHSVPSS